MSRLLFLRNDVHTAFPLAGIQLLNNQGPHYLGDSDPGSAKVKQDPVIVDQECAFSLSISIHFFPFPSKLTKAFLALPVSLQTLTRKSEPAGKKQAPIGCD
jgi:hypothetical protein